MATEAPIEGTVCNWAEEDGWHVRKLGYPGRRGAPDRMFIKDGRVVFVEFKRPGKKADALQRRELSKLLAHGADVLTCDSIEEACAHLGIEPR